MAQIALPGFGGSAPGNTTSSSSGGSSGAREPDSPLPSGTKLGGFEIRRVLGRGGMATVYKGIQLSLNRPVAVKVLAKRFARNQAFVERFDREAGALAGLNHSNIVNIIDKGVVDDNYYFVMEIVEGITLDQLLHSVELTEQHYLHVIGEISKALTYVHSRGIIHRDIKPSNILVNRQGVVKVGDFGIAHIADGALPAERVGRNATIGTAHYMSPEQASDPGSVDQRADIYSLGVTFYKMFTRQLPPAGASSATPPTEINAKLPKAVDAILAKAMDPVPANRFQTVAQFCDELTQAFTARSGSDLLGAAASMTGNLTESGTFLFNTNLFNAAAASSVPSSSTAISAAAVGAASMNSPSMTLPPPPPGTSLLVPPMGIPGLDSSDGTPTYGNPVVSPSSFSLGAPSMMRNEPSSVVVEEEPPSRRNRLYLILAIIAVIVAAAVFSVVWFWWLPYSAYGQQIGR